MEKSYQLCDAGNKIVLRQLTEPNYEMRTVLVADALIDIRDTHRNKGQTLGDDPFFILKAGEKYFLCWERRKLLQIASAEAYCLVDGNVLLKRENCWYWWSAEADVSGLQPLGQKITSLDRIFILKQRQDYVLSYFERGILQMCHCLDYKVLNENISLDEDKPRELFPDVLRFIEEKGEYFLSIEKISEFSQAHGRHIKNISYSFIFKENASDELIKFTAYVRSFCQRMTANGVGITDVAKICEYSYVQNYLEANLKISMHINLQGGFHSNVMIYVNISKLYRGEKEAYQIYCAELDYYNTADNVCLENGSRHKKLIIQSGNKKDVISCAVGYLDEKALSLNKNV